MKQLCNKVLKHFLRQLGPPAVELDFVLQDVEGPVNVGEAFRIADACGVREVVLSDIRVPPPHPTIAGIGRCTHQRVPWQTTNYAANTVEKYKEEGYLACALEVATDAVPYGCVKFLCQSKLSYQVTPLYTL